MVLDVFPTGMEALLYGGFRGEAWIQPGKEATQVGCYAEGCRRGSARVYLAAAIPSWLRPIRQAVTLPTEAWHASGLSCVCLQGALYRAKAAGQASRGAVALVLGAGNQLPVVVLDILHKLVSGPGLSAATSLHLPAPASAPFPCPWPAVERQPCAPAGYAASSP
jgi:hypothetical protein